MDALKLYNVILVTHLREYKELYKQEQLSSQRQISAGKIDFVVVVSFLSSLSLSFLSFSYLYTSESSRESRPVETSCHAAAASTI